MEKILIAQEAIYIIAFINAFWACCLWEESIILKKSTITRLKRVMISLDIVITAAAVVVYAIDPYFLFADWVIVISLALAVVTQWLTIRFLRERIEKMPEEKRLTTKMVNWFMKLDRLMSGETEAYQKDASERSEK